MIGDRQVQRAGSGSTQVQGDINVTYTGMTVAEVWSLMTVFDQQVIQAREHEQQARATLELRLQAFEGRLIPSLAEHGLLDAFADPAFIRALKKAQEAAASTEREADYDMLTALLKDRAEHPRDRPKLAGIERSIEIVDRVDDEALRGLTVFVALTGWRPGFDISGGLDAYDKALASLLDGPLPMGSDWLDHLDILDAVRLNTLSSMKDFDTYVAERMPGFLAPGADAAAAPTTIGGAFPDMRWGELIGPHDLIPGKIRVRTLDEESLRVQFAGQPQDLIDAIVEGAKRDFGLGQQDADAHAELMRRIRAMPALGPIAEWWGQIPSAFGLTVVGRTLARANLYRIDESEAFPRP
ncbi:LPO_1073/Vpar_1526 family protein [Agromyces allii]|uniref:Uncharacterized protein n=1 Tax=Agromyces allii TaxID=393607 RepID=A0ABN2Q2J5_9MICO|nr:LPO_1073/Vpar_1526 family protein [Agromyces allii]